MLQILKNGKYLFFDFKKEKNKDNEDKKEKDQMIEKPYIKHKMLIPNIKEG